MKLASELYPELGTGNAGTGNEEETATNSDQEEEEDLEKQLAKELAAMKKPRKQQIFGMFFSSHL